MNKRKQKTKPAILGLFHKDPPCGQKLTSDGFCTVCRHFPDKENVTSKLFCWKCESEIKGGNVCTKCNTIQELVSTK